METVRQVIAEIPDEAFTGLTTKVGIRISTNACYENSRAEGGTAQAINDIVYEARSGRKCKILDLETGKVAEHKALEDCTVGEYIFWRCLEESMTQFPSELRKAEIVGAQEPGKTRVVTKSTVVTKIVLDVVHSVCSWPLTKVDSSESGMMKDNHGWNFFKKFFQHKDILFDEESKREVVDEMGVIHILAKYKDLFVCSTDFSTATDFMQHDIARIIGNLWMTKCGIPAFLRGFVNAICFQPRKLSFRALGPLGKYGKIIDKENSINEITMVRGVMMGDPLTKVLLHLFNIVIRKTAIRLDPILIASLHQDQ
jgi:hypothetical protein